MEGGKGCKMKVLDHSVNKDVNMMVARNVLAHGTFFCPYISWLTFAVPEADLPVFWLPVIIFPALFLFSESTLPSVACLKRVDPNQC